MNRNDIIINIAKKSGIPKTNCEEVLNLFVQEVQDCLANGDKLTIKGFMSFEVNERPEREGRNPQTGIVTKFPPVKSIRCKMCKAIKDAVNQT